MAWMNDAFLFFVAYPWIPATGFCIAILLLAVRLAHFIDREERSL